MLDFGSTQCHVEDWTWRVILLGVAISGCIHCGSDGTDVVSSHTQGACAFKHCSFGTVGPTMCQETSLTTLHHHQQPELLVQRIDPTFYLVLQLILTLPSKCCNGNQQSRQYFTIFYCSVLVSWCKLYPQFPVLC